MTGSMGQVNFQNKMYSQPENFNGNPAFAPISDNTLVKKALEEKKSLEGNQDNDSFISSIAKSSATFATGVVGCYALDKSTNYLVKGDRFHQTRLYKLQNRLDNSKLGQSKFVKTIEQFIENQSAKLKQTHTNLLTKPWYQDASARFTKGMEIKSHLAIPLAKEGLTKEYGEAVQKILGSKHPQTQVISDILKNEKDFDKAFKEIKKAAFDKSVTNDLREALKKSPEVKNYFNKITGLNHIGKNGGLLSKILLKGNMEASHFLGGGKLAILMNGYFISDTIKNAINAPKGEKLSTFMEDLLGNWIGGWVLMIPAAKAVNGLRGFTDFQASQGSGFMKKAGAKLVRGMSKLLDIGKNHTWPEIGKTTNGFWKKTGAVFTRWLPRALPGGITRMVATMLLVYPFQKGLEGISHMIFGKPTHPEEKPEQPQQPQQPVQPQNQTNTNMNDFLNKIKSTQPQNQQVQPNSEPVRTYIPSPEPAKFEKQPDDKTGKMLTATDNLIKQAEDHLTQAKGKYK